MERRYSKRWNSKPNERWPPNFPGIPLGTPPVTSRIKNIMKETCPHQMTKAVRATVCLLALAVLPLSIAADPKGHRAKKSSTKKPEAGTPATRFLESLESQPADPQEFADALHVALTERDFMATMRTLVPLGRMDQRQIEELIAVVEQGGGHPSRPEIVLPVLWGFAVDKGADIRVALDRLLPLRISFGEELRGQMAVWMEKDADAALAWYRQRRDEGALYDWGERWVLMAMIPTLAKNDPDRVVSLLPEIGEGAAEKVREILVGELLSKGGEGGERARELLLAVQDEPQRFDLFRKALRSHDEGLPLEEGVAYVASLGFTKGRRAEALAALAAQYRRLPVGQRGDWLLGQLGDTHPVAVRRFVEDVHRQATEVQVYEWINSLPAGAIKEQALEGEMSRVDTMVLTGSIERLLIHARQLSDEDRRKEVVDRVRFLGEIHHPKATSEALKKLGIE